MTNTGHDLINHREPMKRDRQSDADKMSLPDGKTCGDCVYFLRCFAFYGHIAGDEVCDWAPLRFTPRADRPAQPGKGGEA